MQADLIPSLEIDWVNGTATKKIVVDNLTRNFRMPIYYDADHCSYYFKALPNDFIITFKYCLRRLCKLSTKVKQWMGNGTQVLFDKFRQPIFDEHLHKYLINPENALFPHIDALSSTKVAHMFDGIKLKKKVERFLTEIGYKAQDHEMYDYILRNLPFTYSKDLRIHWGRATRLPTKLHINERCVIRKDGSTVSHLSDHWVLIDKNGKKTLFEGEPTDGVLIDGDSGRTIEVYSKVPVNVPKNILKAVKITIGCNPVEGDMRGISIMSYRRF